MLHDFLSSADFLHIDIFEKFFKAYHQSDKQFGPDQQNVSVDNSSI